MAEFDTSVFRPFIQNPQDIALKQQQLQAGNVDVETKKRVFATQAILGSTDQNSYDQNKAFLQKLGIDTSGFAPDFETGMRQAQQLRIAQAPAMSLLNTALKMDSVTNPVSLAGGNLPAGGGLAITSQLLNGGGLGNPSPASYYPPPAPNQSIPGYGQTISATPRVQPPDAVPRGPESPELQDAMNQYAQTKGVSQVPPKLPNETLEAWKARVANDPQAQAAIEQAKTKAAATGKASGEAEIEATNSQAITDRLRQNVQKLLEINDKTPDSSLMSPDTKAYMSKRFGSGDDANYAAQWDQVDQQQILSDYGQLVKSGAIRGSRQIFQALQTGSGIPIDMPRKARADLLNNLMSEIENKNISTQNVNSSLNGGQQQAYQPIGQQKSVDPSKIPMQAVQKLRANAGNPQAARDFDEIFGQGASKMILGGQ